MDASGIKVTWEDKEGVSGRPHGPVPQARQLYLVLGLLYGRHDTGTPPDRDTYPGERSSVRVSCDAE